MVLLYDERAQVLIVIDLGEHGEDVRETAVGDPHLLAVDQVVLAIGRQHRFRLSAVGIAARAWFSEAVACLPFAAGQFRDVLLALRFVAVVQDRQGADSCVRRNGHAEAVARAGAFSGQHRRYEVLSEATEFFWHADAEQTEFTRFLQQFHHQPFFLLVDAFHVRPYLLGQEVHAGLRDHALLLVEFLWNENVLWCALADQEFAALQRFGIGLCCHGFRCASVLRYWEGVRSGKR